MPSSKRVNGNFNIWSGATEDWTYFDTPSNSTVTVRRGNLDTVFQSSNLVVYGNIVSRGGDIYADEIYANIVGNITISGGVNYGILYKSPTGDAAVSSDFIIDPSNLAASINGNFIVAGSGAGTVTANNVQANVITAPLANLSSANIGTANVTTSIKAQSYLNLSGANVLYANSNVFNYLGNSNTNTKFLYLGNNPATPGSIEGNGTINISGNINTSGYVLGNGAFLTGISAGYSNSNVSAYLASGANINISTTGNITAANISGSYILGNGRFLTGMPEIYSNADVANYLPTYGGNALFGNAEITGLTNFSDVSNLRIPGGSLGQFLSTDGNGIVSFNSVTATPGNITGSFQYNNNGNLYGLDDFVYLYADPGNVTPALQLSNLSFNIDKANGNSNVQLNVIGNTRVAESPSDSNTGYILIGGIERLLPLDLEGNTYSNQFIVVNGNRFDYANGYANANAVSYSESGWDGNIIPGANGVYSLGSSTNQWKDLWVGNSTIYLGNVPLNVSNNSLLVNGQPVLSNNSSIPINTNSNITTSANVSGTYFIGNGALLTGLPAEYSNANVASYLGNQEAIAILITGDITTSSNISGNYFIGNGALLTGIVANTSYGNSDVAAYLASNSAVTIETTSDITANSVISNLLANSIMPSLSNGQLSNNTVDIGDSQYYFRTIYANELRIPPATTGGITLIQPANGVGESGVAFFDAALGQTTDIIANNLYINSIDATGNIIVDTFVEAGQLIALSNVSASGNILGDYILGNGAFLTGVYSNSDVANYLASGASVTILTNGNITGGNLISDNSIESNGTVTAGSIYTTGTLTSGTQNINGNLYVSGNVDITGNLNYANVNNLVINDPLVYLGANNTGNVYDLGLVVTYNDGLAQYGGWARDASDGTWKLFGNVVSPPTTTIDFANAVYQPMRAGAITAISGTFSQTIVATGNVTGGNFSTGGTINAVGNITAGNIVSNTAISATGNVTGGNFSTGGKINAVGNITAGNIVSNTAISATGNIISSANISGTYILGNGAFLTGVGAGSSYGNSNVASYLSSNAAITILTTGNITSTANISGSYLLGNGRFLSGLPNGTGSFANGGYTQLTNGLILQWGINGVPYSFTSTVISWPTAFPTQCVGAWCQPTIALGSGVAAPVVTSANTTSMTVYGDYSGGSTGNLATYWLALGY